MSRNSSISTEDGKIIFISDLEGCAEFSTTSQFGPWKSSPQSQILCSSKFFDRLDQFLLEKSGNKVVFLGDYFDKGPLALQSIELIVSLYEMHNKISKPKKVYIILGNRDLNKLRLPYELQEDIIKGCSPSEINNNKSNPKIFRWGIWKTFYQQFLKSTNESPNKDPNQTVHRQNAIKENNNRIPAEFKKKLEIILETSMGALDNPNINASGKNNYISKTANKKNNILEKTIRNLEGILTFNIETNGIRVGFCDAVIKLFNYGTIVEYDPTYKVLMSHAGGMDENIFNKLQKTEDLLEVFKKANSNNVLNNDSKTSSPNKVSNYLNMDYFSRIEWFRRELSKPLSNIYNKNSSISSIDDLCNSMNSILDKVNNNTDGFTNFSQKVNNSNNKNSIYPEYYLLQAMGLKGDAGKPFLSFVESCDTPGGCGGPKDSTATYSAFLKELNKMGVDVISCGHISQCIPVPLIYKRQTFKSTTGKKV
jgi:hypothetical protein